MQYRQVLTIGLFGPIFFAFTSFAQKANSPEEVKYQDRQRAINLTLRRADIKNLEDAAMRCFVRTQVVRFIFEKKVTSHFDVADEFALSCFEDIQKNPDQFSEAQRTHWESNLLTLLRANSPETAAIAIKKFSLNKGGVGSELLEIENSSDLNGLVGQISVRVARGDIPPDLYPIFIRLRQKNALLANNILSALLTFYESALDLSSRSNSLAFFYGHFLEPSLPIEIRTRFLRFSVRFAQSQLNIPQSTQLLEISHSILKDALPKLQEELPELFDAAKSIFVVLDVRLASINREQEEALGRIEAASDKLQQTMIEAESVKNSALRDSLWLQAVHLAVSKKKFKTAADCIMKFSTEIKEGSAARDNLLLNVLLSAAILAKDLESAEFAVSLVTDPYEKAGGFLKIAKGYLEKGDKSGAVETIEGALKIVEWNAVTAATVKLICAAVPIALKIDKFRGFETGRMAIAKANRLPAPGPDDKVGSVLRVKYVDSILLPTAFNIAANFNELAKRDVNFAFSIAQEVQPKGLALVAEIIVETERIYPMPKKAMISPPTATSLRSR